MLIDRIEGGDVLSREDLQRVALLQALDVARAGELYLEEALEEENAADERFREHLEAR